MLDLATRRWCLEQAIEIVKHAPADTHAVHERLKRVYKRMLDLVEHTQQEPKPPVIAHSD
jgi:hypothetical protein